MESQLECWRQICILRGFDFFWALVQLVYLPVATTALSTFNCRKDNGPDYMTSAPYLECHQSDRLTVSILLVLAFVVPFPLVSIWRFHRAKKANDKHLLGLLREPERMWWWVPVVMDGRRLVIAMLVSLLEWQSPFRVCGVGWHAGCCFVPETLRD